MENKVGRERTILKPGEILVSPGRNYVVDSCIGCGSNAIVYLGHYSDNQIKDLKHRILIKELYPFDGDGKIFRNMNGDIIVDPSAKEFYTVHEESYRRGNIFHANILNEHPGELDFFIDTFTCHNTLYSILEFTGGRSALQEVKNNQSVPLERIVAWMKGILNILKVFHDAGYLHLDISLDNILLTGSGEKERVSLIDYNSSVSIDAVHGSCDIILSAKEGYEYTAPEVLRAEREKIGPCTDLYSVTAVFFRLLFGRRRTTFERINKFKMPDTSQVDTLNSRYPIVIDMIASILRKGFQANSRLRYQSADQMLTDLKELEERMKCRGITQWALWQKGRDRAVNIIRRNTALHYIMDPEKMYPLKAQRTAAEDTENILLSDDNYLKKMTGNRPVLLLGSGGMGKTTAMLRLAYSGSGKYTERSTAVVYISLFDWREGDRIYIQDKILEYMDYSHELQENARKELRRLLSDAIHTKSGDIPRLLLCLDGLNEASGDVGPLLDEIQELCALSGVKIILTSRSEIVGDEYEKWTLARLTPEEVRAVLRAHRVPSPENMEILEMLQVPMMLSMYMEALDGRKVLKLNSRDELMEEYLAVLTVKEARDGLVAGTAVDIQNSPAYFGAQAAVKYVLPEIAALIEKKKRALKEKELFQCVAECYRYLDKKAFTAVFEKWIGHVKDLKLGAANADEWYGRIVQTILWQKLGLLVKDEEENYRIVHQITEEYMAQKSREFHADFDREKKKLRNRKQIYIGSSAAAAVILLVSLFAIYNLSVNRRLTQQNREILQNESEALAFQSEELLADGNRLGAVETALAALPTEGNERPYVASAEKALADALYVYQDEQYAPAYQIRQDTEIHSYDVSDDGNIIAVLDNYGILNVYQNGILSWTLDVGNTYSPGLGIQDSYIAVQYLENSNCVLVIGSWFNVICCNADNGDVCWVLSVRDELNFYVIDEVELSSDSEIIALCGETLDGYKVAFLDTLSGNVLNETDLGVVNYETVAAKGTCFIKNSEEFLCVICDEPYDTGAGAQVKYTIYRIDVETGTILQKPWVKMDRVANHPSIVVSAAYIPRWELSIRNATPAGIFVYICEYGTGADYGTAAIGFWSEETDEWMDYHTLTALSASPEMPPEIYVNSEGNIILSGCSSSVYIYSNGLEKNRISYDEKVIYQYQRSLDEICLFFADGTVKTLSFDDFELELSDSSEYTFSEYELSGTEGSEQSGFAFAGLLEGSVNTVNVFQNADDENLITAEPPQNHEYETLTGRIYQIPDQNKFLYCEWDSAYCPADRDSLGSLWYHNYGTLYNSEGEILNSFSFDAPVSFDDFSCFSKDGNKIYFNGGYNGLYIYDIENSDLQHISLNTSINDIKYRSVKSVLVGDDVITISVSDHTLLCWTNGEEQHTIDIPEIADFSNLALSENGNIILWNDEENMYDEKSTYHFWTYDIGDRALKNDVSESLPSGGNYCYAVGKDTESLAIITSYSSNEVYIWHNSLDNAHCIVSDAISGSNVRSMEFIMEDRYLLVKNYPYNTEYGGNIWISIVSAETGETVYTYYVGSDYYYDYSVSAAEDRENARLYLMADGGDMPGLCIDTETWETLFEIPGLRCVFSDSYVCSDAQQIKVGCLYSTSDLISMGQALLNS